MKKLLILVCLMVLGTAQAQGDRVEDIKARCAADWPGDYAMQVYCADRQFEAIDELVALADTNGGVPVNVFAEILYNCYLDWPKDYTMKVYCVNRQLEAYKKIAGY